MHTHVLLLVVNSILISVLFTNCLPLQLVLLTCMLCDFVSLYSCVANNFAQSFIFFASLLKKPSTNSGGIFHFIDHALFSTAACLLMYCSPFQASKSKFLHTNSTNSADQRTVFAGKVSKSIIIAYMHMYIYVYIIITQIIEY